MKGVMDIQAVLKAIQLMQQLIWEDMEPMKCNRIYKELHRTIDQPIELPVFVDCIDKDALLQELRAAIHRGLLWSDTPQGFNFWSDTHAMLGDALQRNTLW